MKISKKNMKPEITMARAHLAARITGIQEILSWIPTFYADDLPFLACADSKNTYIGTEGIKLSLVEQATLILHELFHVLLQHAQSTNEKKAHPIISNIVQDALINEAIISSKEYKAGYLRLPEGGIVFENITKLCVGHQFKKWNNYDWYTLYRLYLKHGKISPNGIKIQSHYFEQIDKGKCLKIPDNFTPDIDFKHLSVGNQDNTHIQQILQQLKNNNYNQHNNSLICQLLKIIPDCYKVDPQKLLKKYLTRWMGNALLSNTNRPTREFLIDIVPYIETQELEVHNIMNIAVVFDTSGSMNDDVILKSIITLDKVKTAFNFAFKTWVISADDKVQSVDLIGDKTLYSLIKSKTIQFKGKGSTNFVPAIKKAKELNVKLCLYFTDTFGNFGSKPPNMDIIWLATQKVDIAPPFGKLIPLV